jgi:hypothetical protein
MLFRVQARSSRTRTLMATRYWFSSTLALGTTVESAGMPPPLVPSSEEGRRYVSDNDRQHPSNDHPPTSVTNWVWW